MSLFKNIRIDRLLFGSFAAFIAALLMLFTWISYTLTSRELADNTFLYQQDVLNELNKQLDIQLRSIEQMSLAASRNMVTIGYDPLENDVFERLRRKDDLYKMLASITYSTTMVQSIYVFMETPPQSEPQGPVQFISLQRVQQQSWYPQIQKNDFAWIPEHTLQTNTGPQRFISFVRKMYNNSGIYEGLLMLNVKAAEIENLIRGETTGRNRVLLDNSGTTIAMTGNPVFDAEELENIRSQEEKSDYIRMPSAQGEDVLLVWNKARSGWMLVEVTPWRNVIHGSVRLAYILVFTGLSAIFLASFFTLFISRQFTKPIRQLVSIMGRVPAKGAMADLPGDYKNEFGYLFNGYRRQMERIEELLRSLETQHKRQKEAEILALQAMINPHFLYNTLDQLNWLAIESGQEKISRILSLVGKMFRIGLSNGATMIPVQDEMTHVECYLEIQKIRWGERLTYSIVMDEAMKELYMPRITLQPFVENAFIHGFHGRKSGEIRIEAHVRDGDIMFDITDNGVGLQPGWEREKPRKTGGYGIRNVKERIAAYVGAPYGITIRNLETGGTRVTILLPIIEHKPETEERIHVENSDY
ncbi:sensor histidine kinase [Paenibacillus sp. GCM10023248]|uniref:cache domain-containing sensor histidine kinase n=1 Tax=Bacillales TaxID=1385 RepID=UPI0023790716|nr:MULTISPECIES: sensor histidine kinase [Bacillales]MDD9267045.1 sensor histidine kinase [Paenibacillus sp. MAHUQ-63]MDR6881246.1 two-component system sensor histidine kinase YesM [Bacillus sp. 3255]